MKSKAATTEDTPKIGWRKHMRNFRHRVNVDRFLAIIAMLAIIVVGWNGHQTSKSYSTFTHCTVDYFVKDKVARDATTKASRKLVAANNAAFKTIPDFFGLLSTAARPKKPPTPAESKKATEELLNFSDNISDKFNKSNDRYLEYLQAIKKNPPPPDPNKFCKDKGAN